ncbi:hypothetical protein BJY04DRAFT_226929 [Aspergillus karnatakaensis]|uniref:Gfo/Idh/MocA family protein n=1 Tax=Aspergillus karnatakaensis TaxID=1810916 RepID=UPI003CCDD496
MKQLTFLIIGAGSRGNAYARAITRSTPARIAAIAEPNPYKRRAFGEAYIWGSEGPKASQEFQGWEEWIDYETKRRESIQSTNGASDELDAGVDGLLICTLDETHITILSALAENNLLDLHILCEKPLAVSLQDCLSVLAARAKNPSAKNSIFSIGHVLRYSPHNLLLRKLVREDKVIGDIVSVEHTEPVGYWHFAHSYVRGNWRRETPAGDGSLLTKSCHDVDFLLWLIEAPVHKPATSITTGTANGNSNNDTTATAIGPGTGNPERSLRLRSIHSTGHLTQFRPDQKPPSAGSATNCITCPIERQCIYSSIRVYRDNQLRKGETGWPVDIVCPDIEDYLPKEASDKFSKGGMDGAKDDGGWGEIDISAAEAHLIDTLAQDYTPDTPDEEIKKRPWYGRCVYESDNDVVDDQVVVLSWDVVPPSPSTSTSTPISNTNTRHRHPSTTTPRNKKLNPGLTATLHMTAPTAAQCIRRGRIYGTRGEITYTSSSITIHSFTSSSSSSSSAITTQTINVPNPPPEEAESHGGGDYGLARGFVGAVNAIVNDGWDGERAQRVFVGCTAEEVVRSHAVVFAAEESRRDERVLGWEGWWRERMGGVGLEV